MNLKKRVEVPQPQFRARPYLLVQEKEDNYYYFLFRLVAVTIS
jgi:hypothetical protein